MNIQQTYISKGSKPWWKFIFSAFCFTIAIYIPYNSITTYDPSEFTSLKATIIIASLMLPFIVLGIVFSMVKDFHFDFIQKRYKIVKRVGPFGYGRWKNFEALNYLSVCENLDSLYELKLWYNENQHYSIDIFKKRKDAVEAGKDLAKNLFIDFYSAGTSFIYSEEEINVIEITDDKRTMDVHISEGTRPIWQTFIAAMLYTAALVSLYFFYKTFYIDLENKRIEYYLDILEITAILFSAGIGFSVVKDYLFDFKNKQYKIIFRVGPFKIGKWYNFRNIDYIYVFKKNESEYLVNLWYNTNKHFKLSMHNKADIAVFVGRELAKKLKIDLLDATDPHNSKWVENLNP